MPLLESGSNTDVRTTVSSPASNAPTPMDIEDGGPYRPRSNSGGIKDFFRRRNKSSDPEKDKQRAANAAVTNGPSVIGTQPQGTKSSGAVTSSPQPGGGGGNKMKQKLFSAIRPRSKSDAQALQPVGRPRSRTVDDDGAPAFAQQPSPLVHQSNDTSALDKMDILAKSPPSGTALTSHMARLHAEHLQHSQSVGGNGSTPAAESGSKPSDAMNPEQFVAAFRERAYTDPRQQRTRQAAMAAVRKKQVRPPCACAHLSYV